MTTYRIVKKQGAYYVDWKFGFLWLSVMTLGDYPISFKTQKEAEDAIKKWKEPDVIVKEY